MKFNNPQDFDMKKLLINLDWSFETSENKISPQINNDFFTLQNTISDLSSPIVTALIKNLC
jgi:hypothetical protein